MGRRRTPEEKKQLSYTRDRRNNYGENDKSSRKSVRRNKQAVNSANRRRARTTMATLAGTAAPDERSAEAVELSMLRYRPKAWRKFPDAPLGVMVIGTLRRRMRLGMDDPSQAGERVRRIRHHLGATD